MGHSVHPRPRQGAIGCEKTAVRQVARAQRPPVQADNPEATIEALTDICERSIELVDRYKAGIDVYNAVITRIIVIGERYYGPEKMGYTTIPKRH